MAAGAFRRKITMDCFTICVLVAIVVVALGVWGSKARKKASLLAVGKMETDIKGLKNFEVTQRFFSEYKYPGEQTGIVVDENSEKICFLSSIQPCQLFNFKDVIESEIIEDGYSVTKSSRTSQAGGAVVGGLLFGGAGAIIGGLSGSKKTTKNVTRIDLKIVVNDLSNPIYTINFLNRSAGRPVLSGEYEYKQAMEQAMKCHSMISIIIKRATKDSNEKTY